MKTNYLLEEEMWKKIKVTMENSCEELKTSKQCKGKRWDQMNE